MGKYFNVNGACFPDEHYMVDLSGRLEKIRKLVDDGKYFVINRARQYGKTTTLWALGEYLRADYIVFSLSFQRMSSAVFQNEYAFSREFARMILRAVHNRRRKTDGLSEEDIRALETGALSGSMNLADLFYLLSGLCETAARPVVLMIDEVDNASNNRPNRRRFFLLFARAAQVLRQQLISMPGPAHKKNAMPLNHAQRYLSIYYLLLVCPYNPALIFRHAVTPVRKN